MGMGIQVGKKTVGSQIRKEIREMVAQPFQSQISKQITKAAAQAVLSIPMNDSVGVSEYTPINEAWATMENLIDRSLVEELAESENQINDVKQVKKTEVEFSKEADAVWAKIRQLLAVTPSTLLWNTPKAKQFASAEKAWAEIKRLKTPSTQSLLSKLFTKTPNDTDTLKKTIKTEIDKAKTEMSQELKLFTVDKKDGQGEKSDAASEVAEVIWQFCATGPKICRDLKALTAKVTESSKTPSIGDFLSVLRDPENNKQIQLDRDLAKVEAGLVSAFSEYSKKATVSTQYDVTMNYTRKNMFHTRRDFLSIVQDERMTQDNRFEDMTKLLTEVNQLDQILADSVAETIKNNSPKEMPELDQQIPESGQETKRRTIVQKGALAFLKAHPLFKDVHEYLLSRMKNMVNVDHRNLVENVYGLLVENAKSSNGAGDYHKKLLTKIRDEIETLMQKLMTSYAKMTQQVMTSTDLCISKGEVRTEEDKKCTISEDDKTQDISEQSILEVLRRLKNNHADLEKKLEKVTPKTKPWSIFSLRKSKTKSTTDETKDGSSPEETENPKTIPEVLNGMTADHELLQKKVETSRENYLKKMLERIKIHHQNYEDVKKKLKTNVGKIHAFRQKLLESIKSDANNSSAQKRLARLAADKKKSAVGIKKAELEVLEETIINALIRYGQDTIMNHEPKDLPEYTADGCMAAFGSTRNEKHETNEKASALGSTENEKNKTNDRDEINEKLCNAAVVVARFCDMDKNLTQEIGFSPSSASIKTNPTDTLCETTFKPLYKLAKLKVSDNNASNGQVQFVEKIEQTATTTKKDYEIIVNITAPNTGDGQLSIPSTLKLEDHLHALKNVIDQANVMSIAYLAFAFNRWSPISPNFWQSQLLTTEKRREDFAKMRPGAKKNLDVGKSNVESIQQFRILVKRRTGQIDNAKASWKTRKAELMAKNYTTLLLGSIFF